MKQIKSLASVGLGDIIGSGITAAFWFYLAILMNPDSFGELHYFISIAAIVSYFALIGSQNTITVYVAKKIPIQTTFNFISLIGGIIGFVILYLLFQRIDIGFLVFGYIIYNLVTGQLLGKQEYKNYFKYVIIQKILTPVFGLGLFFILDIQGVIYGLAISYVFFSFVIIKNFTKVKIDFKLLYPRKGFIINNYLHGLTGTLHGQADKIIIMPILGAALLGNYSLSLQIISMMMIFSAILYKYMLPQESAGYNVELIKKLLIFSSIILTIIGFFIVPMIVPAIFPKYTDAIEPIKIMSFSIIPMSISKIYTSKFLSMEKSKVIFIGSVTSTVILIPTMIAFGIWFDISGIAASFVLATIIQASYYYLASKKLNKGENTAI